MNIKYCCYDCKHFKECTGSTGPRGRICYNAMGGKEYMQYCDVKDGTCNTHATAGGTIGEQNQGCWEEKVKP